ncbi:dihydrodipicolinate synthase family protein (plasmid) [Deinococcus metallilatus]|uniref:4-hydroxy-tetrahydrodipicolinate synthase n=1 Tax=Deinococcus metallilatus TaxID=1211322 RepID=A0ABR6MYB9_9DEIO|nr:dihydrodipicolinate synthase family protein [Deinococcus metallilatus]MBB5296953.1 4-hydroxy-tetrahydrodipicolinate synthase [Deinococcus metallilatus]QBY06679.1 dihydrodipicolinate synthase family protein [Deinococcus metallilatus]GMA15148.1 dihydrodipicolinate synthase family protein [Deinococcus metallilatus]
MQLHGIIPPVVTPLTPDFQVDEPALRRVLRHLLDGGVHGLFLLGSTSEVVFMDAPQRREVLRIAVDEVAGRVPLLAGVIDPTTDRVIAHARDAQAAGVDGLVVTAPFYTRTSQAEIVEHFRAVRQAVPLPIMAYDIPVCVHVKLERPTLRQMRAEGLIEGLKDSSGDDTNFRLLALECQDDPDFRLFTGSELMVDTALLVGAHGCVPGLGNVDPAGYVALYGAARREDWPEARRLQERLIRLFGIALQGTPRTSPNASGVGGFKTALHLLGLVPTHHMHRPNAPLNAEETRRVEAILAAEGLLAHA